MSTRDEQWWDLQAGELVLGTLDDHELELFDSIRKRDLEFEKRVVWWQERFSTLDRNAPPITPDATVWKKIEAQLGLPSQQIDLAVLNEYNQNNAESILDQTIELEQVQDAFHLDQSESQNIGDETERLPTITQTKHSVKPESPPSSSDTIAQSSEKDTDEKHEQSVDATSTRSDTRPTHPRNVNIWRDITILATAASIVMAIVAWNAKINNKRQLEPIVATSSLDGISMVLNDQKQPLWILHSIAEQSVLQVATVRGSNPGADKSYQLWLEKVDDSGVTSMGLLPTQQGETVDLDMTALHQQGSTQDTKSFAVSLEPSGGTDADAPTGPVLFRGEFLKLKRN